MCVRVRNERPCQFSKFTVQKGTSYRRSIFSTLQRTLQSNRKRFSYANRNRYETRMITKIILHVSVKRNGFTIDARRDEYVLSKC